VHAINARLETWTSGALFDIVISRAFAELSGFVSAAGRFCAPGGVLAAMKGVYPDEEIARMPTEYVVSGVLPLGVPGVAAERHLVLVKRAERAS
jgi:16S rRNA (guanine527-N7)-methyltransferase